MMNTKVMLMTYKFYPILIQKINKFLSKDEIRAEKQRFYSN